jgi:hypothetical protein
MSVAGCTVISPAEGDAAGDAKLTCGWGMSEAEASNSSAMNVSATSSVLQRRQRGGQRLRDRVGRAGLRADDAAQDLGQRRRVREAQPIDARDQGLARDGPAGLVELGHEAADGGDQLRVAPHEDHVAARIDRDAGREPAGLLAEHGLQSRRDLGGVGVAHRHRRDLASAALVEGARDRLDAVHVLGVVGHHECVRLGQRLDVAEGRHQRPQRGHGRGRRHVAQLHEPGDDVEPPGLGRLVELGPGREHGLLRDHPPDVARAQRREALDPQDGLEQVPHARLVERLGRDHGDLARHGGVEDEGAAGDPGDLLGERPDVGVAQVDHEAAVVHRLRRSGGEGCEQQQERSQECLGHGAGLDPHHRRGNDITTVSPLRITSSLARPEATISSKSRWSSSIFPTCCPFTLATTSPGSSPARSMRSEPPSPTV